jgi:hypothetical protein
MEAAVPGVMPGGRTSCVCIAQTSTAQHGSSRSHRLARLWRRWSAASASVPDLKSARGGQLFCHLPDLRDRGQKHEAVDSLMSEVGLPIRLAHSSVEGKWGEARDLRHRKTTRVVRRVRETWSAPKGPEWIRNHKGLRARKDEKGRQILSRSLCTRRQTRRE